MSSKVQAWNGVKSYPKKLDEKKPSNRRKYLTGQNPKAIMMTDKNLFDVNNIKYV
jgi:hypothetical protein